MYLTLSPKPKLDISDKNDLNKILDWQWVKTENLYFVEYPVDLDILTFTLTASVGREDRINLLVDDPDACKDVSELTNLVADLLWRDIFYNDSKSYLCNRNLKEAKLAKNIVFYFSMVWVGYDLTCSHFQQKTKVVSTKESGPVIITYVCFFVALFYPLIFKLLNLKSIITKLKIDKKGRFDKKYLTSYQKEDVPFGFQRMILKFFYQIKYVPCEDEGEDTYTWNFVQNMASCRLVSMLFIILSSMSAYRFYMELHSSRSYGSVTEYPDVYRVGLPLGFLRGYKELDITLYFVLLFIGHVLLKVSYVSMCGGEVTTHTVNQNSNLLSVSSRSSTQKYQSTTQTANKNSEEITKESRSDTQKNQPSAHRPSEKFKMKSVPRKGYKPKGDPTTHTADEKPKEENDSNGNATKIKEVTRIEEVPAKRMRPLSHFIRHDQFSYFFTMRFIERFMVIISQTFWSTLFDDVKENCSDCKMCFFVTFIPFICFYFLTSCFPVVWFVFYGSRELAHRAIKMCSAIYNRKQNDCCLDSCSDNCSDNCSRCLRCFFEYCLAVTISVIMMFSQWVILCSITFLLRSFTYIFFVAVTANVHYTRILIVTLTTFGYMLSFLRKGISEYKNTLDFIFKMKEEIVGENQNESNQNQNAHNDIQRIKTDIVYEYEFDQVVDAFSSIRQKVFWNTLKLVISCCFFLVATRILLLNNKFDNSTTEYFVKLAFIISSPQLLFTFLTPSNEKHIEDNKDRIKDLLKKSQTETLVINYENSCVTSFCSCLDDVITCKCKCCRNKCKCKCCRNKCSIEDNVQSNLLDREKINENSQTESDDDPSSCICPILIMYCCCECTCKKPKRRV